MAKLAVNGGTPVRTGQWSEWPLHDENEEEALLEVLRSGKWWHGERVVEFEEKFAAFQDARFGVTTNSGTAALETALRCCGVGPGDEVIVPPYTFIATSNAVLLAGAVPVFCDIELETFNIDPDQVEAHVTTNTKAIVPVHFAGLPCDMERLNDIASRHDLVVIEDACHSWGSKWNGKGTGALGDAGAFSFQMSKNITSAEGGVLLTDSEELAELFRSFTNCGRGKKGPWYHHARLGGNYRMTEFQAAVLVVQLGRLQAQNARRAENAAYLNGKLGDVPGLHVLPDEPRARPRAYHLYCLRYSAEEFGGLSREKFIEASEAEGVPFRPGYLSPVYKNTAYADLVGPDDGPLRLAGAERLNYGEVECPNCERLCKEALWLSQNILLGTSEDMDDIVRTVEKVRENAGELL